MTPTSVLLVDDDHLVLELYALALHQRGFVVHQASDGATARAVLREERPDIACLDGRLVYDAGGDLAAELNSAGTRVVLFTNDQTLFDHPPKSIAARLIKANTSPKQLAAELGRLLEGSAEEAPA